MDKKPQLTETQLQALLRVKRHEQPPPGYFDDLLASVQRRQREEMLARPAWRLFLERAGAFLAPLRTDWSYAASMAAVLLVGVGAIQLALPQKQQQQQQGAVAQAIVAPATQALAASTRDNLTLPPGRTNMEIMRAKRPIQNAPDAPTRFVIDAQPASYEQPQIRF